MPTEFQPGQRVTAEVYGERRAGTVTRFALYRAGHPSAVVWVQWDGQRRESWQHAESLTLLPED